MPTPTQQLDQDQAQLDLGQGGAVAPVAPVAQEQNDHDSKRLKCPLWFVPLKS